MEKLTYRKYLKYVGGIGFMVGKEGWEVYIESNSELKKVYCGWDITDANERRSRRLANREFRFAILGLKRVIAYTNLKSKSSFDIIANQYHHNAPKTIFHLMESIMSKIKTRDLILLGENKNSTIKSTSYVDGTFDVTISL